MQIFDVLKKDHDTIRHLLFMIEASSDTSLKRRTELLKRFHEEFIPHTHAEEKVLYDTLKDIDATENLALEGYEEHGAIEGLLRELESISPSDERWLPRFMVLKDNIVRHVEFEETTMFDYAREVLAPEESDMMADAFRRLRAEVQNGSLMQTALEMVAQYMPARFSRRFSDFTRRV